MRWNKSEKGGESERDRDRQTDRDRDIERQREADRQRQRGVMHSAQVKTIGCKLEHPISQSIIELQPHYSRIIHTCNYLLAPLSSTPAVMLSVYVT